MGVKQQSGCPTVRVRLIRDWGFRRKGLILNTSPGVADVLVNRRRPPMAEYVEGDVSRAETLVPAVPGVSQILSSLKRKKGP